MPPHRGREEGGRGGERAGHTGQQRSLAVNYGHSKIGPDQGGNALTRHEGPKPSGVRFPQLHKRKAPATRYFAGNSAEEGRSPRGSDAVTRGFVAGWTGAPPCITALIASLQLNGTRTHASRRKSVRRADDCTRIVRYGQVAVQRPDVLQATIAVTSSSRATGCNRTLPGSAGSAMRSRGRSRSLRRPHPRAQRQLTEPTFPQSPS